MNEIPAKRQRALDQLRRNQRKLQLDRFLDNFKIEDAKIEGIGAGRKRTLESYGIETAEDIVDSRIKAVPGFGPKMVDKLLKWRQSIEVRFMFDPTKAISQMDIARVEQEILKARIQALASAKAAYDEAIQSHARIMSLRNSMRAHVVVLHAKVAQARADYQLVKG